MESRGVFTFFTIGFLLVALLITALVLSGIRHDRLEMYDQIDTSSNVNATAFAVIAPLESAVGDEITVTIVAIDKKGFAVPDFTGTVNIETNIPDIPDKINLTAGDFGRQQLKFTATSEGEFTIKVYDSARDIKGELRILVKEASEVSPTETEQTTPEETPLETTPSNEAPPETAPEDILINPSEEPIAPLDIPQ